MRVERFLDEGGGAVVKADLDVECRVAPTAYEQGAVATLTPVLVAVVRVDRPFGHDPADWRRLQHLASDRNDRHPRQKLGHVGVGGNEHKGRHQLVPAGPDPRWLSRLEPLDRDTGAHNAWRKTASQRDDGGAGFDLAVLRVQQAAEVAFDQVDAVRMPGSLEAVLAQECR